jgi:nicotinate-nucleotide--dimethylbenzimidazole phosphoribosyltransferase
VTPSWTVPPLDRAAEQAALARQQQLTKPPGSLGRLEEVAVWLAALQGQPIPSARPAAAILFAADHPVAARGVSAYPTEVTRAMVGNFVAGGAAASVLSRQLAVDLEVVDVGVAGGPVDVPRTAVRYRRASVADADAGDLVDRDAMTEPVYDAALAAGAAAIDRLAGDVRIVALGEMGIGNTTAAAAVGAALLGRPARELVGPGTGLDRAGVDRKVELVDRALARARHAESPHAVCRALGGRDIAALVGAIGRAAERRIAVVIDGFIVGAAALVACRACPALTERLLFAHQSREPGHRQILDALAARPLLSLEMALGEASGALSALPLIDLACALHRDMASFESAGVPDRDA